MLSDLIKQCLRPGISGIHRTSLDRFFDYISINHYKDQTIVHVVDGNSFAAYDVKIQANGYIYLGRLVLVLMALN